MGDREGRTMPANNCNDDDETDPLLGDSDKSDPAAAAATPAVPKSGSRWLRVVTVEPVVFLTTAIFVVVFGAVRVQFLVHAVGKSLNYTTHAKDGKQLGVCTVNESDPDYILGQRVQAIASYWALGFNATSSLLTLVSALFLGSYSERGGGRKLPLLVPPVGILLGTVVLMIVIRFDLPIAYIFISEAVRGITGGLFLTIAIASAYMADITTKEQLTMRLIIVETAAYLGGSLSQIGVGHWIEQAGFIPPLWMSVGVMAFTIFYIIVWVEETKTRQKVNISFSDQFKDVGRLFSNRTRGDAYKMALLTFVVFLYAIVFSSLSITLLYIMAPPYCFNAVYFGYYQAVALMASGIGLVVGGKLLSCCLGDLGMSQVSCLSGIGYNLFIGYALNPIMLLCAPVVGCLSSINSPAIRSRISKLVNPSEQGILFSFLGCIQGIAQTFSPLAFNTIYSTTVEFMPSIVYLVFVSVIVVQCTMIGNQNLMAAVAITGIGGLLGLVGSTTIASAVLLYFKPALLYFAYVRYILLKLGLGVKYLKAGDFTFCYAERGKGKSSKPTMLFLHGYSGAKDMWAQMIKALPKDVHVIILDMPGHGNTSRETNADYTFVGQAENVHKFVVAYGLNKSRFHLSGISMGGGVAGVYAAMYPQDLVKLSLFCPAGIVTPKVSKYGQEMVKGDKIPLPETVEEIKKTQPYIFHKNREMPNWVYRLIVEVRKPHNEFYKHLLHEISKENSRDALQTRLQDIQTPTQVIWGEFDELLDISSLDVIKKDLRSLERVDVLDRCGHSITIERPYKSAKILLEFANA